jgi:hypothetical protein
VESIVLMAEKERYYIKESTIYHLNSPQTLNM